MQYESPEILANYSEEELTSEATVSMQYGVPDRRRDLIPTPFHKEYQDMTYDAPEILASYSEEELTGEATVSMQYMVEVPANPV